MKTVLILFVSGRAFVLRDPSFEKSLDQQLFNLLLNGGDLRLQLGALVGGDTASDDWARDAACTAESLLRANEYVWDVLVLAQQWQVQQDLQWLSIGGQNDEFGESAVECLGGFVSSASQLLVVDGLLDQGHDLRGQGGVSQRVCFGINFIGLKTNKQKFKVKKFPMW